MHCGVVVLLFLLLPPAWTAETVREHTVFSNLFGGGRTIRVMVPPDYDEPANQHRHYPVLYLNDGQNLFSVETSTFNRMEWRVDETLQQLYREAAVEPLIVVGIDHPGKRARAREYLPYPDAELQPPEPNPQGHLYPGFLFDEVMPFVDRLYRTSREPKDTGIGGSSYGAVAALYTALSSPGAFGKLLLESPSLYIDDRRLLLDARGVEAWPDKIWLAVGTNEAGRQDWSEEAVADVRALAEILRAAGLSTERVSVTYEEGGLHNEDAWGRRFSEALRFLFGR
jgi:isoamylase